MRRKPESYPVARRNREQPPIATFGQLLKGDTKWFWLHCSTMGCGHRVALPLAPFAVRWGEKTPAVPIIRRSFRCSACGEKATVLSQSSGKLGVDPDLGNPFPVQDGLKVLPDGAWLDAMCNLYSINRPRDEIRVLVGAIRDLTSNQPPLPGVFPDYQAPIVRMENGERIIANARWGLPSPAFALKGRNYDGGVTNVRNMASSHWRRWLGPEYRCLVPFSSFSEPKEQPDGKKLPAWFAFDETRPIAFFAGIWVPQWKSVRKVKEGETVNDLYAFLTTEPNAEVKVVHPKAMPVILTMPDEWSTWLTASTPEALKLQRPLPDGALKIVAEGERKDGQQLVCN